MSTLMVSRFLFLVFFISLFCCGSVRQIKLAMLAFGRTLIYVVEIEVEISRHRLSPYTAYYH